MLYKARLSVLMLAIVVLVSACAGSSDDSTPISSTNPDATYVTSSQFPFPAFVNPFSLMPLPIPQIDFFQPFTGVHELQYALLNQADLDAFNLIIDPSEVLLLPDLLTHSYFLIQLPACPDFFEFVDIDYSNGTLTITVNQFTLAALVCTAVWSESYFLFKLEKL
ncbi:MAG: hypothetical protein BMS9Abin33_0977 [Gammaproteobacteria bacterium]|nr:MAG: hypothetical protein BMS9Abin33_0977 [Gammaproteobacteria bacterium]